MVAIGHLTGYVIGTMDLVKIFGPTFGDTQFKQLILVSAFALIISCGVTSWAVTERVLISGRDADAPHKGIIEIIRHIFKTATSLPPRIQAICNMLEKSTSDTMLLMMSSSQKTHWEILGG